MLHGHYTLCTPWCLLYLISKYFLTPFSPHVSVGVAQCSVKRVQCHNADVFYFIFSTFFSFVAGEHLYLV